MDWQAPNGVPMKPFGFGNFIGMSSAHDRNAMDTGDKQALWMMNNCSTDYSGLIVRDPGAIRMPYSQNRLPVEINFYGFDADCAWAEITGSGIDLVTDDGVRQEDAFTLNSAVSSTVFGNAVYFMSPNQKMWRCTGPIFENNNSPNAPMPGFGCVIGRRLAVAGMPDKPTEIWFSRVDDADTWPLDEDPLSKDGFRAAFLDIRNVIGLSDRIVGLSAFEVDRVAIFTQNRVIIYTIVPDLSLDSAGNPSWQIDDRASINIGCVSHSAIIPINVPQSIGATLVYLSYAGVYKLERVGYGGTVIYANPVTNNVRYLIRNMVDQTVDPAQINGYFDPINNQVHFLFPRVGGYKRLTFTIPLDPQSPERWSMGDFLGLACGAVQGGTTMLGGKGGIYKMAKPYQSLTDTLAQEFAVELPDMTFETPLLWHGDMINKKQSMMFVMQAFGHGEIVVEAFDELNRQLCSMLYPLTMEPDTGEFPDTPVDWQFHRKFEFDYRGVWFRFTGRGLGLIRVSAFAVFVRVPERKR